MTRARWQFRSLPTPRIVRHQPLNLPHQRRPLQKYARHAREQALRDLGHVVRHFAHLAGLQREEVEHIAFGNGLLNTTSRVARASMPYGAASKAVLPKRKAQTGASGAGADTAGGGTGGTAGEDHTTSAPSEASASLSYGFTVAQAWESGSPPNPLELAEQELISEAISAKLYKINGASNGIVLRKVASRPGLLPAQLGNHPRYNDGVRSMVKKETRVLLRETGERSVADLVRRHPDLVRQRIAAIEARARNFVVNWKSKSGFDVLK